MLSLTAEEVEQLAAVAPAPSDTLLFLLAYGGLRWGEVGALRRGRCDLLRRRLEVAESLSEVGGEFHFGPTKTYERRTVLLPSFLVEMLAAHLHVSATGDPSALVFRSPRGAPLRYSNFRSRVWKRAVRDAGLDEGLRIHDLRHTCASLLIDQDAHPKAVQAHLGHSSITVTMDRYGHLFPHQFESIAADLNAVREAAADRMRTKQPQTASDLSSQQHRKAV